MANLTPNAGTSTRTAARTGAGTSDDLRSALETAATHAIAFHDRRPDLPGGASATVEEMRRLFDRPTPEAGEAATRVIEELARAGDHGIAGTAGPRFFGWVMGGSHPAGVAADWLTSIWGQNGGNYLASPANAVAEQVSSRWLLDMLRLPAECSIGFTTGATMANFVCLAAARHEVLRRVGWDVEAQGLSGGPAVEVLIGDDAHATVFAALQFLGFGCERATRISSDAQGRMRLDALAAALARGHGPRIVIAQAGQINTGAFDPLDRLIALAQAHEAWVHIDGAFGLWARASASLAPLAAGAEGADSWATDGHKWLQTPYDCGFAIVRNEAAHRASMAIGASYLPAAGEGGRDPSHYVPELSRRARGFSTWALLRVFGRSGIAEMVERHCACARQMAALLAAEPGVAVLNDVVLNQVIVRFGTGDETARDAATAGVIARVQRNGTCFAGGARWHGTWVMRLSIIGWPTQPSDIDLSAAAIIDCWRAEQDAARVPHSRTTR